MREALAFATAPKTVTLMWHAHPQGVEVVGLLAELLGVAGLATAAAVAVLDAPLVVAASMALAWCIVVSIFAVWRRRPARLRIVLASGVMASGLALLAIWLVSLAGLVTALVIASLGIPLLWLFAVAAHGWIAKTQGDTPFTFWWRTTLETTGNLALLGIVGVGATWVWPVYRVPSLSMWPTLFGSETHGEVIWCDRTHYWFADPARWEVVVLEHPGFDTKLVKRIVGLPGDSVRLNGGNVWINGHVAWRPPAVQYSQMRREPIYALHVETSRRAFLHAAQTRAQQANQPFGEAELQAATEAWQADCAKRFAQWWAIEQPLLPVPQSPSQSQSQSQPQTRARRVVRHMPLDGITLMPGDTLRLIGVPVDPALAHFRARFIADDLALEIIGDFPNPNPAPLPSLQATFDVSCLAWHAQHVFQLTTKPESPETFTVTGFAATSTGGEPLVVRDALAPINRPRQNHQVALRMQNIDGVWDLWLDGVRVRPLGEDTARQSAVVPGAADGVSICLTTQSEFRIRSLTLTTPTYYLPYGLLSGPPDVVVPPRGYLCLGDNSDISADSRSWEAKEVEFADGRRVQMPFSADPPEGATGVRIVPVPFAKREWLVGRVLGVIAPLAAARSVR